MKTSDSGTEDQTYREGVPKIELDGNFEEQALCQLNPNELALNVNHLSAALAERFFIFPDFIHIFGEKRA